MLRVAVIGSGTMGMVHSNAYEQMPDVHLAGIVDRSQVRGETLARERGTNAYRSLDDLFANEQVDVVDICLPTDLHRVYADKAFAAGKHVICEKPIARTLSDALAMRDASQAAGVQLHVAQVLRFFPEYKAAREIVQRGELGEIGMAQAVRGGVFPQGTEDWYASVERSGSLIVDMMIHDFDFFRWCFGEIERVYSRNLLHNEMNRIDHAFVSLRFKNGVIAHLEGTWAYPSGFHTVLELAGREGTLRHRSEDSVPVEAFLHAQVASAGGVAVPESPLLKDPYYAELEHFIECIAGNVQPIVSVHDAIMALEISLAALESAQTGRVISMREY